MISQITIFRIRGLHGHLNLDVQFRDNRLIIVGENGSGKTSVLRLLFYFLSGQWTLLHGFHFASLELVIGQDAIALARSEIEAGLSQSEIRTTRRLPPSVRERFRRALQEVKTGRVSPGYLNELAERFRVPMHMLAEAYHDEGGDLFSDAIGQKLERLTEMRSRLGAQLLYLPTYRRIEEEFHFVVRDRSIEEAYEARRSVPSSSREEDSTELIEFGMGDVEAAVERVRTSLKEFARESLEKLTLGYLGDIVDKKYSTVDLGGITGADEGTIRRVLDRIGSHILAVRHKQHVMETVQNVRSAGRAGDEHERVICHYLLKLLEFQEQLGAEEQRITNFCDVCNRYFGEGGKRFIYDSSAFGFKIEAKGPSSELKLQNLSSGEKQAVSLFSHLYLSGTRRFFIIIDEPELSLSVPWQRTFLVDLLATGSCVGLVAATHSPFIYENTLSTYARGLGEFVVGALHA
jgi:predicted ATPase